MKNIVAALLLVALGATSLVAEATTSLSTPSANLQGGGGTVQLNVSISYSESPSALGWTLSLPEGWSFDSVPGGAQPAVSPAQGTTGEIEFAFIQAPANGTQFALKLNYSAGAADAELIGRAIVRIDAEVESVESSLLRLVRS